MTIQHPADRTRRPFGAMAIHEAAAGARHAVTPRVALEQRQHVLGHLTRANT